MDCGVLVLVSGGGPPQNIDWSIASPPAAPFCVLLRSSPSGGRCNHHQRQCVGPRHDGGSWPQRPCPLLETVVLLLSHEAWSVLLVI